MYQTKMEKRYQMRAEGINVSAIVVLTPSEKEILECKDLEKSINKVATDLHVAWAVEINGNVATATVSKQFGPVIGNAQSHEIEIAATNFMSRIRDLKIPCDKIEVKKPTRKNDDYRFIKELVDEWGKGDFPTIGFMMMAEVGPGICTPFGHISTHLSKELCMCYLKVHAND